MNPADPRIKKNKDKQQEFKKKDKVNPNDIKVKEM